MAPANGRRARAGLPNFVTPRTGHRERRAAETRSPEDSNGIALGGSLHANRGERVRESGRGAQALAHEYLGSSALKEWVLQNDDYKYVPSELFKAGGFAEE